MEIIISVEEIEKLILKKYIIKDGWKIIGPHWENYVNPNGFVIELKEEDLK